MIPPGTVVKVRRPGLEVWHSAKLSALGRLEELPSQDLADALRAAVQAGTISRKELAAVATVDESTVSRWLLLRREISPLLYRRALARAVSDVLRVGERLR